MWVKLVEMREDGGGNMKLGCSMKAVDQSTGADLDPSNALLRWMPQPQCLREYEFISTAIG